MSRPTFIKFFTEPSDDAELTCFFCKRTKCDLSFTVYGDGETRIVGVHAECIENHDSREQKRKNV